MHALQQNPLPATRVLIVEPDADTRELYGNALTGSRFEVDEAEDGREALAKAFGFHPTLVIAETRLPFIDGFDLCKLLRLDNKTRDILVLLLTSDPRPVQFDRARFVRANGILVKPCSTEALLRETQRLAERSPERPAWDDCARTETVAEQSESWALPGSTKYAIRAHPRFATTAPSLKPPTLVCPVCYCPLPYDRSYVGGVNERNQEQWDYFVCARRCGTFQYRHRTRKLRPIK